MEKENFPKAETEQKDFQSFNSHKDAAVVDQ